MAASIFKKRHGRPRARLPPCYYDGYLEKRSPKEKAFRRLWTCLCGNTLFFFNSIKDNDYLEKLELSGFISVTDDSSRDRKLEAARFNLRMKDGEVKLTAPSLETRELWKAFISSVAELSVPRSLNLLPGQVHMLREVVEKEKERCKAPPPPPSPAQVVASTRSLYLPLLADMPACFRSVCRMEAEILLKNHPDCGNLLLRPGKDGTSLAATTYQDLNGPVFRHYRVARKEDGGFSIEVDVPVYCATLKDVISHLVERTSGTLKPFILEEPYDKKIIFVGYNDENGERSMQCTTNPISCAPTPPPKPGLSEHESSQDQDSIFEKCFYFNEPYTGESGHEIESVSQPGGHPGRFEAPDTLLGDYEEENSTDHFPTPPPKTVKKALLPKQISLLSTSPSEKHNTSADSSSARVTPIPAPRTSKVIQNEQRKRFMLRSLTNDPLSQTISEELNLKLALRRAKQ